MNTPTFISAGGNTRNSYDHPAWISAGGNTRLSRATCGLHQCWWEHKTFLFHTWSGSLLVGIQDLPVPHVVWISTGGNTRPSCETRGLDQCWWEYKTFLCHTWPGSVLVGIQDLPVPHVAWISADGNTRPSSHTCCAGCCHHCWQLIVPAPHPHPATDEVKDS